MSASFKNRVRKDKYQGILEVYNSSNGQLQIAQLQGPCDQAPHKDIKHEVERWMKAHNERQRR